MQTFKSHTYSSLQSSVNRVQLDRIALIFKRFWGVPHRYLWKLHHVCVNFIFIYWWIIFISSSWTDTVEHHSTYQAFYVGVSTHRHSVKQLTTSRWKFLATQCTRNAHRITTISSFILCCLCLTCVSFTHFCWVASVWKWVKFLITGNRVFEDCKIKSWKQANSRYVDAVRAVQRRNALPAQCSPPTE